jgi:hypothetical protein
MKPVFQTIFGEHGNCMQAAAASLLELPIADVPDFIEAEGDPERLMRLFLGGYGIEMIRRAPYMARAYRGLYFVTGISTQGHEHIVIYREGRLVHDPNPHGRGLVSVDGVLRLIPLSDRARALVA